jgi:hypothetical protein
MLTDQIGSGPVELLKTEEPLLKIKALKNVWRLASEGINIVFIINWAGHCGRRFVAAVYDGKVSH